MYWKMAGGGRNFLWCLEKWNQVSWECCEKPNNTELGSYSSTVKNIKCGKPRKQTLGFKLSNHGYNIAGHFST